MAEAAVFTLVETTSRILHYLYTVKEGGQARERLKFELGTVYRLVQSLKEQLGADPNSSESQPEWQQALTILDEKGGLLERLRHELDHLEQKLTSSSSPFGQAMTSLIWPFTEKYAIELIMACFSF